MEIILISLSGIALVGATIYLIYFFISLNKHVVKEEEKHYSNSNNYSGVNYNAEYKFDGKYKKNEYVTMSAVLFSIILLGVYVYFQYYDGKSTFNNSYSRRNSVSHTRLFGISASALSGKRTSYMGRPKRSRKRLGLRGRKSFRSRSYKKGGK